MALLLSACSAEPDNGSNFTDPNPDDIEVRVRNQTSQVINDIELSNFSNTLNYGMLSSNSSSNYKSFQFMYSYVGISFSVDGHDFSYEPTSFEKKELSKDFRYQLSILSLDTLDRSFRFRLESMN